LDSAISTGVRSIVIDSVDDRMEGNLHIISDLSWLRYETQLDLVLRNIENGGRLLDVGCGMGFTSAIIAASKPDLLVDGLDIDGMTVWASLSRYGARYIAYRGGAIPFGDKTFDYCVAFGVVEHTEDDVKFLREVNRVLKESGHLFIFNLPNSYALFERVASLVGIKSHDKSYDSSQVKRLMGYSGFTIGSIKREFFLPSQVARLSNRLCNVYNRFHVQIYQVDKWLNGVVNNFSQSYVIEAIKVKS
jgi:SAM-dependent methyltransferase